MNDEDCQQEINLTLNEPLLKRFKKQLEKLSNFASETESSPLNLPILDPEAITNPQRSTLERWRDSFNSLSKCEINEATEMYDISDSFFSDPIINNDENELDFEIDGLSDVDQEIFSEISCKYNSNEAYHRVKIIKIEDSFYHIEGQRFQHPQKIFECVLIKNDSTLIEFAPIRVVVRGDWLQCRFFDDMIINIIGSIVNGEIFIDDASNYLVVSPDILINNTAIAESFACMRKAVIAYRTTVSVEDNKPSASLVIGSIVHELVEEAFRNGFSREIGADDLKLNSLIKGHIEKIFCCEKDEKFVREKVLEIIANFPKWHALYLRKVPALHGFVQDPMRSKASSKSNEKSTICITQVLNLEENIWSAMFGLKGKIDATVLSRYKSGNFTSEPILTPFELKTGQTTTSVAHRAQTLLYTLLLFDRYKRPIDYGLLYYISTGDLIRMPSFRDEIRLILIKRNLLAQEIGKTSEAFPEQIRNEHMCKQCNHVDSCVMIHRLTEKGTVSTSSVPKLFEQKTSHLSENALYEQFFRKWMDLIGLEEEETVKSRSELWRFDTEWRSNRGKCLNGMKLMSCDKIGDDESDEGYLCVLKRGNLKEAENKDSPTPLKSSLLNSYINERDPVVISCENPQTYALATGLVKTIHPDMISIITDRPIKFDSQNGNFCIDRNELTSTFGTMRGNLIKLYSVECQKLMDLVVNLRKPSFLPRGGFDESSLKDFDKFGLMEDYMKMDLDQREAFFRALETKDYLLILGMPGTGKSTTLAFIIRYLVLVLGRTVLISSHTHSAIDHIALKLQERSLPFLRIGHEDKIDGKIAKMNVLDLKTFSTTSEVEHCYASARVVICTSFGMNHEIFMRKRFDYCLVDEASQLTLPACLGALRVAQSFILVGDHFQLPPLVRSRGALKLGFGESLFKILAEAHPQAMTSLCNQYRMNDAIMLMANKLTYQDLLKCGSEAVQKQTLKIDLNQLNSCSSWLQEILSESCKVAFLNTDHVDKFNVNEVVNGNSFHNEGEAEIIKLIVESALKVGVTSDQISLISPYRPQLKYLSFNPSITVSTIDKFQGKDCDFVIISLVRSNAFGAVGELLNDWQRLNVAFTRAKKKLLLVGSERTILQNGSFKKLKDLIEELKWMISL